jgi:NhaP-type Na+/H+ or K+/H+ antiporter
MEGLLIGLAAIVVLGVGSQWLAWRLKLPAILILLLVGFVAGPVTGFIDPDALLGDLLFPIVSLSVAVILFEGGLSLDIAELREIGRVVRNLIIVGVPVTWILSSGLAYSLLGLDLEVAILFGAVLVVTGPTVIIPLLRHIRPDVRVGSAVKWEGIVNDPIGAILGVLMFEAILAGGFEQGIAVAGLGMLKAAVLGTLLGLVGAALVVILLRQYWIPDYLQSPMALSVVILVFAISNQFQEESGLLAVTIMGAALASQQFVTVRHIVEFKENLRVLLISVLFIILAARLPLHDPDYTSAASLAFLGALIFVVRPAAIALSTWRSKFNWRERVFLGFIAPRGIVAAAVVSVFALELVQHGDSSAARLVPLMFLVIVGTVAVYGIVTPFLARRLGVATPNPQGMLIVGAASWVRDMAKALQDQGVRLILADSNWGNVSAARRQGLKTHYANVLTEQALEQLEFELDGIGRLLALTPNDEVNALSALHFGEIFDSSHTFQLPPRDQDTKTGGIPQHLRGRFLFRPDATYERLLGRVRSGAVIKVNRLTDEFDFDAFKELYGESAIPMFAIRESGEVLIMTVQSPPTPKSGHTLISLVDPVEQKPEQ